MANDTTATVILRLRDDFSDKARRVTKNIGEAAKEVSKLERVMGGIKNAFAVGAQASLAADGIARFGQMARQAVEVPLKTSIDFEDQMMRVAAISRATGGELALLTDKARELGRDTRFSATQAAEGMQYLSMSGFTAQEQLDAMRGVLNLAAAGSTDLGQSADIAANILRGFGIEATKMTQVADVLTKTFTTSATDLAMLGDSMKYVAPVARSVGSSIEETASMVGLLGNVGIKGTQAGTSLRAMFLRLAAPTGKVRDHLKGLNEDVGELGRGRDALAWLNVNPTDLEGNFRPMLDILRDIDKAMKMRGLGSGERMGVLNRIFGAEAASAAAELLSRAADKGATGLENYTASIMDAGGTNERVAAMMASTTKGLIDELSSLWEDVNIQLGDSLNPTFRELGDTVRKLIGDFSDWAKEHPALVRDAGKLLITAAALGAVVAPLALGVSAVSSALGAAQLLLAPVTFGFKALGAALRMTSIGAIALTAPVTAITGPMLALGAAVAWIGYEFGTWLDAKLGISDWLADLAHDISGLNDQIEKLGGKTNKRGLQKGGDMFFRDGTVMGADGSVKVKGSEWERHARGMTRDEWDQHQKTKAGSTAAPAAEPAKGEVDVNVKVEDDRVKVTTKQRGGARVSPAAGPAMAGAL